MKSWNACEGVSMLDVLLVNAPSRPRVYQNLASEIAAIEPPIWAGFIASFLRKKRIGVEILDAEAYGFSFHETALEIVSRRPRLCVFSVYGQQPSASTQSMPAAGAVCRLVKGLQGELPLLILGTHPAALPVRTLKEECVDFVATGEGPYTIEGVLAALDSRQFANVPGLAYWENGRAILTKPAPKIQNLDSEIGGVAWDLLPMKKYRAHNWHCWGHIQERSPYASLYTSLGCPFKCSFCCINAPFGGAGIRFFTPPQILNQVDILVEQYGVRNLKIADEMFVLNPTHVEAICEGLIERRYDLNIWAYARVDTVKDRFLEKLKQAGFQWLGIGIESASEFVRDGVEKGKFGNKEISQIVAKIRSHGINVGANYIFGLPDDTPASMQETLYLAMELNTEYANFYSAMAYPGSELHGWAERNHIFLPESPGGPGWIGYSQHAFETLPLPTETLPASEVLRFRDEAFVSYFSSFRYQRLLQERFGREAVEHLTFVLGHELLRKFG